MKNKNVFNLIIEGPDGVGKSTLIQKLFKHYNYRYMCYHRGELSNLVYARKFNRVYYTTQRGLPFLYIYLYCSKDKLKERLEKRDLSDKEEIAKISDVDLFEQAYEDMKNDYDIIRIDTSDMNEDEVLDYTVNYLDKLLRIEMNNNQDKELSSWNKMYKISCEKLGLKFDVLDNQPYINNDPLLVETACHNGKYETFKDNGIYDNLIYAYAYPQITPREKRFDFQYIINSKLKSRPEVFAYYQRFIQNGIACITSNYELVPKNKNFERVDRIFGKDYLEKISEAKATIYCGRDLAYLRLQTARLYEAIIAQNIVFVDEKSDVDNDILMKIHGKEMNGLRVTPNNIVKKYNTIIRDKDKVKEILDTQNKFLEKEFKKLEERYLNK